MSKQLKLKLSTTSTHTYTHLNKLDSYIASHTSLCTQQSNRPAGDKWHNIHLELTDDFQHAAAMGQLSVVTLVKVRLECDHHPCVPVSSVFCADASRTFSPSCVQSALVQAASALQKRSVCYVEQCVSSLDSNKNLPQNVAGSFLSKLPFAWLPHHSRLSHSPGCRHHPYHKTKSS